MIKHQIRNQVSVNGHNREIITEKAMINGNADPEITVQIREDEETQQLTLSLGDAREIIQQLSYLLHEEGRIT